MWLCRTGRVKGNSWFLGSHSWMVVVVPSINIAKTRKVEFGGGGWGVLGCDFLDLSLRPSDVHLPQRLHHILLMFLHH